MTNDEKKQFRNGIIKEMHELAEKAAKSHEEMAKKYPNGPDKIKAKAIRRFFKVFVK